MNYMWNPLHDDDIHAVWVSAVPARTHADDSVIDEGADPGDVKADGGAGRCRHLSALYNHPPEEGVEGASRARHRCLRLDGSIACGGLCSKKG